MQKLKQIFFLFGILLMVCPSFAQAQQDSLNPDPSLKGQYQFMLSRSKTVNGYKLVNPYRLTALWKSVTDTLSKERKQLQAVSQSIKIQSDSLTTLKKEIAGKENSLENSKAMVDEIKFLGISFNKSTYNILIWCIIIILGGGLTFVLFQSGKYRSEATYRTQLYQEVADEFQAHKVKAKEKEMKLARELQDERNKWDEKN